MDVTVLEAAEELGVENRTVRSHILSGRLQVTRVVGHTQLIEHAGIRALQRGSGHGRLWHANTTWAALELLDTGTTERLTGSERSRLRGRLRDLEVTQFAHLASGRGRLRRLAQLRGTTTDLRSHLHLSGMTALEDDNVATAFDLATSASSLTMGYVPDLNTFALRHGMVESTDGALLIRDLATTDAIYLGMATYALDLYELGDTRESGAGARYLSRRLQ